MRLTHCVRGCRIIRLNNFTLCVVLISLIWVNVLLYSLKYAKESVKSKSEIEHKQKLKYSGNQKILEQIKLNQKLIPHGTQPQSPNLNSKIEHSEMTNERLEELSKQFKVKEVDCAKIFDNVPEVVGPAIKYAKGLREQRDILSVRADAYINMTQNCKTFIKSRGYIMSPLTKEEEKFPIAFSIVAYRDTEHMERLLRAIYRPHNFYCIHMDIGKSPSLYQALEAIARCFPNVILPKRRVRVSWGSFSVLEPDVICMEELWARKGWKYFINLSGQEFPLKTNYELVRILTAYNGANDIEGTIKRSNPERWAKVSPPPAGLTVVKGSMKVAANRDMVDFILHNKTGQQLVAWLRSFCDVCIPDEQLFSTLNHNPQLGIRGSYLGVPETDDVIKPFLARYVNWGHDVTVKCADKRFRGVCILSTGDLHYLRDRKELFANKFYLDSNYGDRVALACMEERHINRTRDEFMGTLKFDTTYYENLGFVKNQIIKPEGRE